MLYPIRFTIPRYEPVFDYFIRLGFQEAEIRKSYQAWLGDFCDNLCRYYTAVLTYDGQWEGTLQPEIDYAREIKSMYAPPSQNFINDFFGRLIEIHTSDNILGVGKITEWWFNRLIDTSLDEQTQLKAMPYREYLETEHWRKVRAAMLVATNAMCQVDDCIGADTYWTEGNESDVHVHHMSYKNLGHERLTDLALLCKEHHKHLHDAKQNKVPILFEILKLENRILHL